MAAIAKRQGGVVTRQQVLFAGGTDQLLDSELAGRRWRRVHRGVYVTFTGPLPDDSRRWAAVLACGPGAALCRESALVVDGVLDEAPSDRARAGAPGGAERLISVAVPWERRIAPPHGVRLHRDSRLDSKVHPVAAPPRTRVEDSVLDVLDDCERADAVVDVVLRACQRRRTTARRISEAAAGRSRLRWRALLADLLLDAADGVESPLERRYARDVERPHGLPRGQRQHRERLALGTRWRDVRYGAGVVVELDGRSAHPLELAHRDYARDNTAALRGEAALRYGWRDVAGRPCAVAAQVLELLRRLGWRDAAQACSPACDVRALAAESGSPPGSPRR